MTNDTLVEPFMYGGHLHFKGMPPCHTCEQENKGWDGLRATIGDVLLADKVFKNQAYKKYARRWPYDHTEAPLSLDAKIDASLSDDSFLSDMADKLNLHFEAESRNVVDKFAETLTPKQQEVLYHLLNGEESATFYQGMNYKTTGGVRFHRMNIRRAMRESDDFKV